jgi:3-hydroxybutyryl-CoA dehydrogenase
VHLYEVKESVLRQGMDKIQGNLMKMFAKTKENISTDQHVFLVGEVMERLHIANNLEGAVTQAGLLIEAVKEDHALKADIFHEIFSMKALGEKTIICTNTSSFQVSDFASLSPVLAPRIAGLHFFNPVDKMKLVEIIKTEKLLPEVLQTLRDFVTSLGKP